VCRRQIENVNYDGKKWLYLFVKRWFKLKTTAQSVVFATAFIFCLQNVILHIVKFEKLIQSVLQTSLNSLVSNY